MDAIVIFKRVESGRDRGVRMDWNDELDVVKFAHDDRNGAANRLHARALIFPAMRGQQNAPQTAAVRRGLLDARQR